MACFTSTPRDLLFFGGVLLGWCACVMSNLQNRASSVGDQLDRSSDAPPINTAPIHKAAPFDPDATDCLELLAKFLANDINVTKGNGDLDYHTSVTTVTDTDKPFYISTHDKKIDKIRAYIPVKKHYYEWKLTKHVAEIFDEKSAKGHESIFLDVGANIGWFSLLAAAHGATKVYMFEPNLQNVVRICESLNLNHWLRDDRSKDVLIPIAQGVGNREERKKLYAVGGNNPGSFSFRESAESTAKVVGEMEITTLDHFAERHGWFHSKPSIGMFKLDAENFERYVIEGAEKLLRSKLIETIAMELKPEHSKEDKSKILSILYSAGYELYMHGFRSGPHKKIDKKYIGWEDLLTDFENATFGDNVMFRQKVASG